MWPCLIVFVDPAAGNLTQLIQAAEEIQIQDLIVVGPVKALDVSVLVRLSRLDIVNQHAIVLTPVH